MSQQNRGVFMVLEGIDGCGTTTQLGRVAEFLERRGLSTVSTREPTSGPVGVLLRQALAGQLRNPDESPRELGWESLALLFAADRMDHAARVILPGLLAGKVVLCDRYDLSSRIYQSLTAPDPVRALAWVGELNARATRPDLTIVLDIDASVAEVRRTRRGGEPELFEHRELQERLALEYRTAERYVPNDRVVHLDAEPSVEEVTVEVSRVVERFLAEAPARGRA